MDGGLEAKPPVQARSQKFAMGGLCLGFRGLRPQPPEANGGEAPSARKFCAFFGKNNLILELFKKKIMLLKHGIEIGSST